MLSAMHASTGGCGTWTQPRAAAVSVETVRRGKRRHRCDDSAPATDEDQHPEDVQQVIEPGQDVLDAENV